MKLSRRDFIKLGGAALAAAALTPSALVAGAVVRVPVLMYHDIDVVEPGPDDTTVSPALFSAQMEWLYSSGYRAVSIRDIDAFARAGRDGPERTVVITFDDGYASFMDYAYPLFTDYGFKAVINVIGERAGTYINYGHRRPVLSWDEYRLLVESGVAEIGCHTWGLHTYSKTSERGVLGRTARALSKDFEHFKERLAQETGSSTEILAWPYGLYDRKAMRAAEEAGFRYVFTSNRGYMDAHGAYGEIPRLNINDKTDMDSFRRLVEGEKIG